MVKNCNVRVFGFPKVHYGREWLDTLNGTQLSETALSDGDCILYDDLNTFQNELNDRLVSTKNNWWYFVNWE